MTPGSISATMADPPGEALSLNKVRFSIQGATIAVRLPLSREAATQPVPPSLSRICRQFPNSAMISTGKPARLNTQAMA
jgi:hypothetical protein